MLKIKFSIVYPFEAVFLVRVLFNDYLVLFCVTANVLYKKWTPLFRLNMPPAKRSGTLIVLLAWLQD